jgi:hypothetical protein
MMHIALKAILSHIFKEKRKRKKDQNIKTKYMNTYVSIHIYENLSSNIYRMITYEAIIKLFIFS